jgi:UDP-glucose 4-epimerase
MKKIVVTGVTGQDGSHMVDYLLKLFKQEFGKTDFMLYGTARRLSVKNHENILHLEDEPRFQLINMDLNDAHSIRDVVIDIQPDYFINFAAQSFVAGSWEYPIQTWDTDASSVLHILESIVDLLLIADFITQVLLRSLAMSYIRHKMKIIRYYLSLHMVQPSVPQGISLEFIESHMAYMQCKAGCLTMKVREEGWILLLVKSPIQLPR